MTKYKIEKEWEELHEYFKKEEEIVEALSDSADYFAENDVYEEEQIVELTSEKIFNKLVDDDVLIEVEEETGEEDGEN